jgi:KAP family P-loop domain
VGVGDPARSRRLRINAETSVDASSLVRALATNGTTSDRPVAALAEDQLDRGRFVRLLAGEVLAAPSDAGFVLGLTGPWGTGKTTALHFLEQEIGDRATVLWFNPWLFSGAEQLVSLFFAEVAGQLRDGKGERLKKLGESLAAYGEALSPVAGPMLGPLAGALALPELLRKLAEVPARERYRQVSRELRQSATKLVVFVDDFDRLRHEEVRQVVRLVKLVGDLPNVLYVLAYDQPRIERALGDGVESGRAYLDKIVQAPHALPAISRSRLHTLTLTGLQSALGERELHHFNGDQWSIIASAFLPFVTTIRAAKRFANVAPAALDLADREVAAHDVLGLTALRVFEPDVHAGLAAVQIELTGESDGLELRNRSEVRAERKTRLDDLLGYANDPTTTRDLLRALFPAAPFEGAGQEGGERAWRAKHRVASRTILRAYLHAALEPDQVSATELEQIVGALSDPTLLRELLDRIDSGRLPDLLDRIRDYRERFSEVVNPEAAAVEFLRQEPRLPAREGFFDLSPGMTIEWVIADLIAPVPPGEARTAAILALFDVGSNLSERWRVLTAFGTWPERERRRADDEPVVDEETTARLESRLADEMRRTDPGRLATEPNLRGLLGVLHRDPDEGATRAFLKNATENDGLFLAVAAACIRRIRSSSPPFLRTEMETDAIRQFLGNDSHVAARARAIREADATYSDLERQALNLLLDVS